MPYSTLKNQKILSNTGNEDVRSNYVKKPQAFKFIKKVTPTHVFSCEFRVIFQNTFFNRTPPVPASVKREHVYLWFNDRSSKNLVNIK